MCRRSDLARRPKSHASQTAAGGNRPRPGKGGAHAVMDRPAKITRPGMASASKDLMSPTSVVNMNSKVRYRFRKNLIGIRSEEHTSELQSLMRISYAVFFLKKK